MRELSFPYRSMLDLLKKRDAWFELYGELPTVLLVGCWEWPDGGVGDIGQWAMHYSCPTAGPVVEREGCLQMLKPTLESFIRFVGDE